MANHVKRQPLEAQCPGFFLGSGHEGTPLPIMYQKLQTPRRKTGIQHKPHYLQNTLSTVNHSYQSKNGGNSPEI